MTHQNGFTFSKDLVEKGLETIPEMTRGSIFSNKSK